ncbi:response regulator receiver domain [Pararoseomonas indoligenes]|uniref:Response receiver domain-containing protein n=1 Tax=Roseomonas indoligenes TaxID=2820811 RepID=A0A940SA59_9PROT|nr:response regulator receiver domain [Pararoseomonas indoligenes]MBP0496018.1 hypothetical protein [Pararoseomonas indoligenes]
MPDEVYTEAVRSTFEEKPLRAVLLIDDQFPTYHDLVTSGVPATDPAFRRRFGETDRAHALYNAFKARHMLCDVENSIEHVTPERIRKSDLIVLDYNLGPDESDVERSLGLIRDLSRSDHFNTIVVYTRAPLDDVWLAVAANLRGGWRETHEGETQDHLDRLVTAGHLVEPPIELVRSYVCHGKWTRVDRLLRSSAHQELRQAGVLPGAATAVMEALLHRTLRVMCGERQALEPLEVHGDPSNHDVRWLQAGNCFVAIVGKGVIDPVQPFDLGEIMNGLADALLAWRPNLIQVLLSEVQNILELEALATADEQLRDPHTQVGLWYYLLREIVGLDHHDPAQMRAPLEAIVDKVLDGVRRRLLLDNKLLGFISKVAASEIAQAREDGLDLSASGEGLLRAAHRLARTPVPHEPQATIRRLNVFLSTEPFRRAHLTTGTVFRQPGRPGIWVATSPACDMTLRRPPAAHQPWLHGLHPTSVVVAIRATEDDGAAALERAEHGQHIFLNVNGEDRSFRVMDDTTRQPPYEFIFPADGGRVIRTVPDAPPTFVAFSMTSTAGGELELQQVTLEVIGQLRSSNASRLLQLTGQHLSRIGLDFVSLRREAEET